MSRRTRYFIRVTTPDCCVSYVKVNKAFELEGWVHKNERQELTREDATTAAKLLIQRIADWRGTGRVEVVPTSGGMPITLH